MNADRIAIYGLHGASHTCPADTLASYWAALGAGAEGIVAGLELTGDGTVLCCPSAILRDAQGEHEVLRMSDKDIGAFDAGASFQSTVLDAANQPIGERGEDHPWTGSPIKKAYQHYPSLMQVLQLFGRRTRVLLLLRGDQGPAAASKLAEKTLQLLGDLGLIERVVVLAPPELCEVIHEHSPRSELACIGDSGKPLDENFRIAVQAGAHYLLATIEALLKEPDRCRAKLPLPLLLTSTLMPFAPTPAAFEALRTCESLSGLCFAGVEETVALRSPPACVVSDSFQGSRINEAVWACGYSHQNADTKISQNNALLIEIQDLGEKGQYSGAAALTVLPVHGRFDAQVDFHVAHPAQGTTFELAATGIDPGYHHIVNTDLNSRNVNLTFDVHGAPPYASSERDEDNGFRIGWNNGYNLTRIDTDWAAASANMYNKYGRDVGDGAADSPTGTLRLVRTGAVFNAYYKDKHNRTWVCCGSALVSNLGPDVHLRLGAKHWDKGTGQPPGNTVTFTNFRLYQF